MTPHSALVVDDSRLARVTLKRALEKLDLAVAAVDSGDAALEHLERHAGELPDVVFLDNVMPGMDGLTTARHIRQRWPDLPVVMCTSTVGDDYAREAFEAGASGVIPKPAEFNALSSLVGRLDEPGGAWLTEEGAAAVASMTAPASEPGPREAAQSERTEWGALQEQLDELMRRGEDLAAHNEALLARIKRLETQSAELREAILEEARGVWQAELEALEVRLRAELGDAAIAAFEGRLESLADEMEMRLATQISAQTPSEDALIAAATGQARAIAEEVARDTARAIANEGVITAAEAAQEAARETARPCAEETAATEAQRVSRQLNSELEAAIGETRSALARVAERAGRKHWPVSLAALVLAAAALAAALLG